MMFKKSKFPMMVVACIFGVSGHILASDLTYSAKNSSLRIKDVRARGIYLFNGFLAETLNPISGLSDNANEHWWVEIETENSDRWFILQFGGKRSDNRKYLELSECSSLTQINNRGSSFRAGDDPTIFTLNSFRPDYLTMGQVYEWASRQDNNYGVFSNNCQDLVNRFFFNYNGRSACNPQTNALEVIDHSLTAVDFVVSIATCNIQ